MESAQPTNGSTELRPFSRPLAQRFPGFADTEELNLIDHGDPVRVTGQPSENGTLTATGADDSSPSRLTGMPDPLHAIYGPAAPSRPMMPNELQVWLPVGYRG